MSSKNVLVYGGSGALGAACVEHFKTHAFAVTSIDFVVNKIADHNILIDREFDQWVEQEKFILDAFANHETLASVKFDAILCVAGGWAGGNASDKDMIANADSMWRKSVWSSSIAAVLAAHYMATNGLLVLTGALPAHSGGTPGMIGYGMAKAAVHQLTKSLALEGSGLPAPSAVYCIMPVILDTPMNRKFMPTADHSSWTPLNAVAKKLHSWCVGEDRVKNGSLLKVVTKDNETTFDVVD